MADCTKLKYSNPFTAALAMKAIVAKATEDRPKVPRSIYPCGSCHAWHLTSQRPKGKKSRQLSEILST